MFILTKYYKFAIIYFANFIIGESACAVKHPIFKFACSPAGIKFFDNLTLQKAKC